MTLVVMRASLRQPRSHGQDGLGAVEGLDLALLIHAQHGRRFGRVQIEPDDVPDLVDEQRVAESLKVSTRCG